MVKEWQDDGWRLKFHLMPPAGWLNDPNGLCQFRGEYHVFFQYQPEDAGGVGKTPKVWGHYAGNSLLHMRFEGIPFQTGRLDRNGSYSGCALIENDEMQLYYTGNIRLPGDYDYIHDGRESNTIRVVSRDGAHFGKKELLLKTADYPAECTRHVRDPKVWKENGRYYMVLGARLKGGQGAALVYDSCDLKKWKFLKKITTPEAFGYMWECPDYFTAGEENILSVCPQGLEEEEWQYQNIYQAGYFTVKGDIREEQRLEVFTEWDKGFDFYAPQTFRDEAGRRILIGWAGMPDAGYENPTVTRGWQHALTVPRALSSRNGKILQQPVEELKTLRYGKQEIDPTGSFLLEDGSGDVELQAGDGGREWQILIGNGCALTCHKGVLQLEFSQGWGYGRKIRGTRLEECRNVRILIDTSMLEIYVNDGEIVFTSRFYPEFASGTGTVKPETRTLLLEFNCPGMIAAGWQMREMEIDL